MKRIIILSTFLCAAATSFSATYYFTRGLAAGENPLGDVYTRNWSDINNWSTVSDGDMNGANKGYNHLAQLPSAVPNGKDVVVAVDVFSAQNGAAALPASDDRLLNVDIENLTLGAFNFDNTQSSINKLTGNAITFETTSGSGIVMTKYRPWNNSFVENDIILKGSASTNSMGYRIVNNAGSDASGAGKNLYLNGNITADTSAMDMSTTGSWDFLNLVLDPTKNSVSASNVSNIYVNGTINIGRCLNVSGSTVSSTSSQFGKVYIGGTESNNLTLKVSLITAVLQKLNGARAAGRIELFSQGAVEFTTSDQIPNGIYLQFSKPIATAVEGNPYSGSNIGGIVYMKNNSLSFGEINFRNDLYGTNVIASGVIGKIDFGVANPTEGRTFDFASIVFLQSELTKGNMILSESGLLFVNFDAEKDKVTCVLDEFKYQDDEGWDQNGRIADQIWFDGYGERGVDYIVTSEYDGGLGRYVYGVELIPEASTCASFMGLIVLGLAIYRRRK